MSDNEETKVSDEVLRLFNSDTEEGDFDGLIVLFVCFVCFF